MRTRLLVLVLGIFAMLAAPAGAATLTVSTTFDETNPGDGVCSLREAIQAVDSPGSASGDCASAAFGANTIVLGPNSYQLGGFGLIGATGLEISSTVKNLTIEGAGEQRTSINASVLKDRAFQIDAGASVTIKDLAITSSTAPGGTAPTPAASGAAGTNGGDGENGGAILNNGNLLVSDAAVINSHAGNGGDGGAGGAGAPGVGGKGGDGGNGGNGGGIYNSSSGTLTLNGASFSGDEAGGGGTGGAGGGGLTAGAGGAGGIGGGGGAVANDRGVLSVVGSTLKGNGAGAGGVGGAGGNATDPASTGGNGGAGGGTSGGGGLFEQTGTVTITNSTFASNTGGDGGKGGVGGTGPAADGNGGTGGDGGPGGAVRAINTSGALIGSATLAGNNAGGAGTGGAAGGSNSGTAGAAGAAAVGGGIAATGGPVAVQDSILALNSGNNCAPTSVTDGGHNLGFGDSSCPAGFGTADPDLGPIQDNGGPSSTISLGQGSAAIDAVPATGAGCQPTDQRGVARPAGSACDIGAYEVAGPQASTQPATKVTKTSAQLNANVTPNAGPSKVEFDIGTTTKYGTEWIIPNVEGVTSVPVPFTVHGLKANTTYHYRVTIATMDGSATGTDVTFKTSITPSITGLKMKPSALKAGAQATISYSDTQPATTTFVVQRKQSGRKPWVTVGSFKHTDTSGPNKVTFSGRVHGKKLKPGSYRFRVTPRAKGHTGRAVTLSFKIKS